MSVRPFPERVLNGVVRRGIRLPSALAADQKHASLGSREAGDGGCSRNIGSLDQLPPLHRGALARAYEACDRLVDPARKVCASTVPCAVYPSLGGSGGIVPRRVGSEDHDGTMGGNSVIGGDERLCHKEIGGLALFCKRDCELCSVVMRRRKLLAPACIALGKAIDRCEPVSRDHAESTIARRALEHGRRPAAYSTYIGSSPASFTAEAAESAALAHVLGIVREPTDWFRPTTDLARPLLQATLSMVAAAIHASKKTLQAAHLVSRRRTQLHRALEHVRYHTWTHLKPTGTPCRCCALPGSLVPGVHVRRSRRPVDGASRCRATGGAADQWSGSP